MIVTIITFKKGEIPHPFEKQIVVYNRLIPHFDIDEGILDLVDPDDTEIIEQIEMRFIEKVETRLNSEN